MGLRSAAADRHQLRRAPHPDVPKALPQLLAALLELEVTVGEPDETVDGRLQLGHGLGIVGILVRVGEVGQAQVSEPEALDDLHDLGPPVGLPVDIAALPADGRPPMVEQDVRGLRLGLAVAVHLVDHEAAARPEHAQHLGKDGSRVREVMERVRDADGVERAVREGEVMGVHLDEANVGAIAEGLRKGRRELGVGIDADDLPVVA